LAALAYALVAAGLTIAWRHHSKTDLGFLSALASRKVNIATSSGMAVLLVRAGVFLVLTERLRCSQTLDDACYMGLFFILIPLVYAVVFFVLLTIVLWFVGRIRQTEKASHDGLAF
jgi:amino acid transporter